MLTSENAENSQSETNMEEKKLPPYLDEEYTALAKFWPRVFASLFDTAFIIFPILMVLSALLVLADIPVETVRLGIDTQNLTWMFWMGIVYLTYFTMAVGKYGTTLGKKLLGLKVVCSDGTSVDYKTAFWRALLFYFYNVPLIGFITLLVSSGFVIYGPLHQSLHDKICKTVVLQKKAS